MDFDFKRNAKYFTSNLKMLLSGIIIAVGGAVAAIIFRWWMVLGLISFLILVVGVVLIFASFSGRSNDGDLDNQAEFACNGIFKYAVEKLDLERVYNRALPEFVLAGYDYDEKESRMLKQGRDGNIRSDRYGTFAFIFTPEKLYVFSRRFSLLVNDITESSESFEYNDIEKAEMVDRSYKIMTGPKANKELSVKNESFRLALSDGSERLYCVHNTIDTDNISDNLQRYARQTRAQQQ